MFLHGCRSIPGRSGNGGEFQTWRPCWADIRKDWADDCGRCVLGMTRLKSIWRQGFHRDGSYVQEVVLKLWGFVSEKTAQIIQAIPITDIVKQPALIALRFASLTFQPIQLPKLPR